MKRVANKNTLREQRTRTRSANTLPDSLFLSAGVEAEIFVGPLWVMRVHVADVL